MKNILITTAALLCVLATVLLDRVIQPAALLMLRYIELTFAPPEPQLAPALTLVSAPAEVAKPKARTTRRRTTKSKTVTKND